MNRVDVFVMDVLYVKLCLVADFESVSGINVPTDAVLVPDAIDIITLELEFL